LRFLFGGEIFFGQELAHSSSHSTHARQSFLAVAGQKAHSLSTPHCCVGYIQGAIDASLLPVEVSASREGLYRVCNPDHISMVDMIRPALIAFVDANPNYTLASAAVQAMLGSEVNLSGQLQI
jgi:hypothetical protein